VITLATAQFATGGGKRDAMIPADAELLEASNATTARSSRATIAAASATVSSGVPNGNCWMVTTPIALPACGHTPARTSAEWSACMPRSRPTTRIDAAPNTHVDGSAGL
jgi:hypothetical protein